MSIRQRLDATPTKGAGVPIPRHNRQGALRLRTGVKDELGLDHFEGRS